MKLALITAFPPSKVTLNEYGFHLAKNFVNLNEISSLILMTDKTLASKQLDFENSYKIKVNECWKFNSYFNIFSIIIQTFKEKPDYLLFNLQFVKFGDKKIPAALGLLIPLVLRIFGFKTMVLMHNIMEQVDLENAGFSENKIAQAVYKTIGTTLTFFLLKSNKVAVTIQKYVDVLNAKYKTRNVVLIPHGTFETMKNPVFDLPTGAKKIMAFGKFGTYKKVEIMIEAVEEIRKTSSLDIEIVIAGTDSPNTLGYLQTVKEKYKHVKGLIFTGYVPEEDVEKIFTESALVVFPYTSTTGSSGVLHQAGSYGKAVVMPDLGDLALLVEEEGYQGEFFDPLSSSSLAVAIKKVLENDADRKEMAANNYKAASALTMDKIAKKYIEELKSIR
jgi:glycosyltransferase involved in cell wall biosynthesis